MGAPSNPNKWTVQLRLAYAERFARQHGFLLRSAITEAFGVGAAQASADIQTLLEVHPGCLTYNLNAKRYYWTGGDTLRTAIPFPITGFDFTTDGK